MKKLLLFLLFICQCSFAQDAFHIKSFQFERTKESVIPIFRLGESIEFSFDDLLGTEIDYSYRLTHYSHDWKPSNLKRTEYIQGNEWVRLRNLKNSFNTLQMYTHYSERLPNSYQRILISGNYMLEIVNADEEVILKRKLIVYEELVSVGLEAKRMRNLEQATQKQNLYITIDLGSSLLQNPNQYMHMVLMQNGQFFNVINDVKPQFNLGNQIKYQYDNETSFYAGNEFLFFDNSDIRFTSNTVAKVEANELYQSFLFPDQPRAKLGYTFFQDLNGAFYPSIRYRSDNVKSTEADYAWVYFSLDTPPQKDPIYVGGMFNNYHFTDEFKMEFNKETNRYELATLIKQGFTNYNYYVKKEGEISFADSLDGNFVETENVYHALVYYRAPIDRYDRIIGMGSVQAINVTN